MTNTGIALDVFDAPLIASDNARMASAPAIPYAGTDPFDSEVRERAERESDIEGWEGMGR